MTTPDESRCVREVSLGGTSASAPEVNGGSAAPVRGDRVEAGWARRDANDDSSPPTLSEIVGIRADPSLRLTGVSVEDDVVRVKLMGADGLLVRHFTGSDASRVVADLLAWSNERLGSASPAATT